MKPSWKVRLPHRGMFTTEISKDGYILNLVDHKTVWCILPNGEVAWRRPIEGAWRLLLVDHAVIVVGRTLARIDIESGRVLASRESGSDFFSFHYEHGALINWESRQHSRIDLQTLEPVWHWPDEQGSYHWFEDRLWQSGDDGLVEWVDPVSREQGRMQLHRPLGSHVRQVIDGVCCRFSGPEILGVDVLAGTILWRHFDLRRLPEIGVSSVDHSQTPSIASGYGGRSGKLFFTTYGTSSAVTAFDARSGRALWQRTEEGNLEGLDDEHDRVLFVTGNSEADVKVVALRKSDGHRVAEAYIGDRSSYDIHVIKQFGSRGVVLEGFDRNKNKSIVEMFELQAIEDGIADNQTSFSIPPLDPELRRRIEASWPPRSTEVLAQLKAADPASFAARALTHPDASVRKYAAEMFGETRDESSIAALGTRLENEEFLVLIAAARALVSIGTEASIDVVIEAFKREVAKPVGEARWFANALALAGRRGAEALVQAMKEGKGDLGFVPEGVREANHPDLAPALLGLFKKKKGAGGWEAYEALVRLGPASFQPVIDVLPRLAPFGRARGLDLLGYFRVTAAVPAVLAEAQSTEAAVRVAAVRALGAIGDKAALPVLTTLAGDVDPEIRRHAVEALRHVDLDASLDVLIARLSDDDAAVRGVAADAFADRIDARAVPALLTMISTTGPHAPAAVALANVGQEVVPELLTLLGSRDFCAKYWAITALGWIADERAQRPLAKQAKSTKEVIADAATLALSRVERRLARQ